MSFLIFWEKSITKHMQIQVKAIKIFYFLPIFGLNTVILVAMNCNAPGTYIRINTLNVVYYYYYYYYFILRGGGGWVLLFFFFCFFFVFFLFFFFFFLVLWANSADDKLKTFLLIDLIFHEVSKPVFLENYKKYFELSSAELFIQYAKR